MASFDGVSIIEEERGGLERGREGGREEVRKGETDIHVHVENKIRGYETKVLALRTLIEEGLYKVCNRQPTLTHDPSVQGYTVYGLYTSL